MMLLVLLRALPSGDPWEDPGTLCGRSGTFQNASVCLTILTMSFSFFSGAEEAFRFALERVDSFLSGSGAEGNGWSQGGCLERTSHCGAVFWQGFSDISATCVLWKPKAHFFFFLHFSSLQTGKDCRYLNRNPVQKKISHEKSVSEMKWAELPGPCRALVLLDQKRLFLMFFLE